MYKIEKIYLYTKDVDMRCGINKIQNILAIKFPDSDLLYKLFVFVSKNKKNIKLYYENGKSYWLINNKLPHYKFNCDDSSDIEITEDDLKLMLEGVPSRTKLKKQISI